MSVNIEEKVLVARAMRRFGGSFVQYLGCALECADPINAGKIKETWLEYWAEYLGFAKRGKTNEKN